MSPNSFFSSSRMKLKAGFVLCSLLVVFTMLLSACGAPGTTTTTTKKHKLNIAAFVGDSYTQATSPWAGNPNPGILGMVYEPLFFINLNDNKTTPLLGQSYEWSSDNTKLTVHLRSGVKWSDGQAFSSDDVAFTFNTILKAANGDADTNAVWTYLDSVTNPDASTVVFAFKGPDTPLAYNILGTTYIVSKHGWSSVTDPAKDNPSPIGTGPFVQSKFAPTLITYTRNASYWNASSIQVDELDYPAVKDNQTVQLQLMSGQIDWGGFGPTGSLQDTYVSKDPDHNHYWMALNNIVVLYLNNSSYPLNDPALHQAISAALDRQQMSTQAENGYETPANLAGLPPTNSTFLQSKYANITATPDVAKAQQFLTQGGYTKGSDGFYADKNGKKVSFKIQVPADWSDWVAITNIIKQDLQAVGIDGEIDAVADDAYFANRGSSQFEGLVGGFFAGPTPYYQYNTHLNSANAAPKGWNWGQYKNPKVDDLLKQYAGTSDQSTQTQIINQLEDIFATDLPVIPLVNAASWFEYSTKNFTGFPDKDNPYAIGATYQAPDNEIVVAHLKPAN